MTSSATSRIFEVRVGGADAALDRFEDAWNRVAAGTPGALPQLVLSFPDLPVLLATLSPARWALLAALRAAGPSSIYALAGRLKRDYKNVHTDVARLAALGVIERRPDGRVAVGWDAVRAELRLAG